VFKPRYSRADPPASFPRKRESSYSGMRCTLQALDSRFRGKDAGGGVLFSLNVGAHLDVFSLIVWVGRIGQRCDRSGILRSLIFLTSRRSSLSVGNTESNGDDID